MKNETSNHPRMSEPGQSVDQHLGTTPRRMWYLLLLLIIGVIGMQWLKAASRVTDEQARELIKKGALIVDVRTAGEYAAGSVKGATNIPLDRFEAGIQKVAPDKAKPLLLHCRSGTRSAAALKIAQQLGYTNAHNLGGFDRARKIVEDGR